jgi:hypothetical protein
MLRLHRVMISIRRWIQKREVRHKSVKQRRREWMLRRKSIAHRVTPTPRQMRQLFRCRTMCCWVTEIVSAAVQVQDCCWLLALLHHAVIPLPLRHVRQRSATGYTAPVAGPLGLNINEIGNGDSAGGASEAFECADEGIAD